MEPTSCRQETYVIDSFELVESGDLSQMDQFDGHTQMVSNDVVIIALALPIEGNEKAITMHVSIPKHVSTLQ